MTSALIKLKILFCSFLCRGIFLEFFFNPLPLCERIALTHKKKKTRSTTVSSSFASISPTRNCSNSSTTTCSFLSKKSTNVKVSSGPSSILVWTCKTPSTSWKRYPSRPSFLFEIHPTTKQNKLWMNYFDFLAEC